MTPSHGRRIAGERETAAATANAARTREAVEGAQRACLCCSRESGASEAGKGRPGDGRLRGRLAATCRRLGHARLIRQKEKLIKIKKKTCKLCKHPQTA